MSAAITIAMPRMVPNQLLAEAHAKYPESLARAGAEMRWIELNDPDKAVQDALACDGLLLPGGGDIDPKFYGQERIPACGEPNVLRDIAEPLLLRAFLAADKPVLAICRGIQLMNVALGGDLYQDIKPFEHVPHNDHWGKIHTVTVRRDTLLSRILGQDTVLASWRALRSRTRSSAWACSGTLNGSALPTPPCRGFLMPLWRPANKL